MLALPPLIQDKSRMRKRASTDLCGGRSAMIVPTATVIPDTLCLAALSEVRKRKTLTFRSLAAPKPEQQHHDGPNHRDPHADRYNHDNLFDDWGGMMPSARNRRRLAGSQDTGDRRRKPVDKSGIQKQAHADGRRTC
jgi:hypothetical protein